MNWNLLGTGVALAALTVALALPAAHVFEGMRAVVTGGAFPWGHFLWALGGNIFYAGAALGFFLWSFHDARRRGALLQTGE